MDDHQAKDFIVSLVDGFTERAKVDMDSRIDGWKVDLDKQGMHEVLGGLLARQTTLAMNLARAPHTWNIHVAPVILRAMADAHITFAWLLKDPTDRSRKYIHYGLGQEKLQLEHQTARAEKEGWPEDRREILSRVEDWINFQRHTYFLDVDLGSWSGISTREMAKEADCLDFYNYVYVPFSFCAHSTWNHIAKYNLKDCKNPLHKLHAVPDLREPDVDLHYLYLAAKYLQKTLSAFDEHAQLKVEHESAFGFVCTELQRLDSAEEQAT